MFTKIVGVTHPNKDGSSRQRILKRMRRKECEYEAVYLEPEPDNPYDENAVKVLNIQGEQLGYLNSDLAKDIAKRISQGEKISAVITEFTGGEDEKPTVGCNIEISDEKEVNDSAKEFDKSTDFIFSMLIVLFNDYLHIIFLYQRNVPKKSKNYNKRSSNLSI